MNIPVDSASPVSFLKQNKLHELKLRDQQMKILTVDKKVLALYCGFTNKTIKVIGKNVVIIQPNGWISEKTTLFIITGHERKILGNENLPRIGIEIAQKQPLLPVNNGYCQETTVTAGEPFLPVNRYYRSSGFV